MAERYAGCLQMTEMGLACQHSHDPCSCPAPEGVPTPAQGGELGALQPSHPAPVWNLHVLHW